MIAEMLTAEKLVVPKDTLEFEALVDSFEVVIEGGGVGRMNVEAEVVFELIDVSELADEFALNELFTFGSDTILDTILNSRACFLTLFCFTKTLVVFSM